MDREHPVGHSEGTLALCANEKPRKMPVDGLIGPVHSPFEAGVSPVTCAPKIGQTGDNRSQQSNTEVQRVTNSGFTSNLTTQGLEKSMSNIQLTVQSFKRLLEESLRPILSAFNRINVVLANPSEPQIVSTQDKTDLEKEIAQSEVAASPEQPQPAAETRSQPQPSQEPSAMKYSEQDKGIRQDIVSQSETIASIRANLTTTNIMQWNVNGWKGKTKEAPIKSYVKAVNPMVVILNQPRSAADIVGYTSFASLPAIAATEKINAQVLVRGVTDARIMTRGINYVVVESKHSFGIPTLVVGLYLHPDDQATNEETKQAAERAIVNFEERNNLNPHLVVCSGDLNLTEQEILSKADNGEVLLERFSKMYRSSGTATSTRSERCIDWIATNLRQQHIDLPMMEEQVSDHRPIASSVQLPKREHATRVPNKKACASYVHKALSEKADPSIEALQIIVKQEIARGNRPYRNIKIYDSKQSTINTALLNDVIKAGYRDRHFDKYRGLIKQVADGRFTAESSTAFALLKKLTSYNTFERRDGGIVTAAYHDQRLIDREDLERELARHYRDVHNQVERPDDIPFPTLGVSRSQVIQMCDNVSQGKGITFDSISEEWFKIGKDADCLKREQYCPKCLRKIRFAESLLNSNYWKTTDAKRHFVARLVPLNKEYPRVPELHQYRPIIVSSPVMKFLQGLLMPYLRRWMEKKMVKNQFGFKTGRSIQDCRKFVLDIIHQHRQAKLSCWVMFFDVVSAYDHVRWDVLQERVREEEVFDDDKYFMLWKYLNINRRVTLGKEVVALANGVPQGATDSPAMWNIYSNGIIRKLATMNPQKIKPAAVADDTATVSTSWWLAKQSAEVYEKWCAASGLTINKNKSGIMFFGFGGGQPPAEDKLWGYPVVEKYRYLGGIIDTKLRAMAHMEYISRKIGFLQYKLTPIRMLKELRMSINLFRVLCMPLIRMGLLTADASASSTDRQNYFRMIRTKFKSFCMLPKCTPNQIVRMLLGSVETTASNLALKTKEHLAQDGLQEQQVLADDPEKASAYYSHVPSRVYQLLELTYRRACTRHNVILCRSHLTKEHGYSYNLKKVLELYQFKNRRGQVNKMIKGWCDHIRPLGARFSSQTTLAARPGGEEERENAE